MVSTLPDAMMQNQPDVRQQFFADIDTRRPSDISSAIQSLRLTSAQIAGMLHTVVKSLLGKARSLRIWHECGQVIRSGFRSRQAWECSGCANSHPWSVSHDSLRKVGRSGSSRR